MRFQGFRPSTLNSKLLKPSFGRLGSHFHGFGLGVRGSVARSYGLGLRVSCRGFGLGCGTTCIVSPQRPKL